MSGPAWELESEYPSIESKEFQREVALSEKMISDFPMPSAKPSIEEIKTAIVKERDTSTVIMNLWFHCLNTGAVDKNDDEAKKWSKRLQDLQTNLSVRYLPFELAIPELSDSDFQKLISFPEVEGEKFSLQQERLLKDQKLSREEEVIIEKMRSPGSQSWANLYEQVSDSIQVEIEMDGKKSFVGLGQAQAMTKGFKEAEKKSAWQGMQKVWKTHEQSAAYALNAMADWSFREIELRSKKKKIHFLDHSLHINRISKQTLETMMSEIEKALPQLQKSLKEMAAILEKKKLDSWDLICAGPEAKEQIPFEQAFALIEKGFHEVSSELGQFAQMMLDKKWIEARDMESKSTGGYCMSYPKSRTPRIFQTYRGSYSDIFTVAHELGHAYHAWVLRDKPLRFSNYPMTLAETASNVGEFALFDSVQKSEGKTPQVSWLFLERMHGYLINVVARFHFEKEFYEKRQHGSLSANEIRELQVQVWKKWYGDNVNQTDEYFWANKGHFYSPGPAFYNYPYTVGYLLSQCIYAQREKFGKEFWPRYKALLMDTGVMTCEDVIQKHLGLDIKKPEFWNSGLQALIAKI